MADAELDEVEQLMPRTKAANERAEVDLDRLKEYMDITQQDQSLVVSQRTSVMIRSDVRKDADGFEDIDDFWADDDMGGEKDDTEGEESSFLSEGATSSANQSMVSTTSEREVNLSGLEAASSDDDDNDIDNNDANMDEEADMDAATNAHVNSEPRGQHNLSSDTMELESQPSQRGDSLDGDQVDAADADATATASSKSKSPRAAMTPMKKKKKPSSRPSSYASDEEHKSSDQAAPSPSSPPFDRSMDADVSFGQDNARTPSSSAKKQLAGLATPAKSKANQRTSSRSTSPTLSSGSKAAQKKKLKLRRESREFSFGEPGGDDGFGGDVSSPFSIQDGVLTPLSNASEKNLPSIKPFSSAASDSPNIRVQLFKKKSSSATDEDDDDGHAWDGDNITKRAKKPKISKKSKEELSTTPTRKPTRKAKYKSTPASDMDEDELTDKDDGSFTANNTSGMASDDNDSDWDNEKGNKSVDVSRVRSVRDGDLSYADEVLRDSQGNALDGEGLRRSKRQRYKPLAWYKGEHYVYERRQSGVGLVIPTVLGIERAGSTTPMKKNRPTTATKRGTSTRPRNTKPLSRDKLPKGLKIDDGEWADLWDITADAMNKMNVICRANEIEHRELPSVDDLPAGFAGQSFNLRNPTPFSRWICGRLNLPPGAAKEAESVGDAVQVFFVMGCQPQSLEVAFGPAQDGYFDPKNATRFLLNPSDELYIPAQNAYYLKNHSETATSELHFMILKGGDTTAARSAGARSAREEEEHKDGEAQEEEEPVSSPEDKPTKQRKRKRTKA